jgi:hypothetical protein
MEGDGEVMGSKVYLFLTPKIANISEIFLARILKLYIEV